MDYHCGYVIGVIMLTLASVIDANHYCDSSVHRCRGHHNVVLKYHRKSECEYKGDGYKGDGLAWDCSGAKDKCICLNAKDICEVVWFYTSQSPAVAGNGPDGYGSGQKTGLNGTITGTPAPGTGTEMCANTYQGDGYACDDHNMCKPIPGGISLCCSFKCVHVHNVPCVRDFMPPIDQHCRDSEWNKVFGN